MAKVLVTGGAGYIGSTTASVLLSQGYDVVVYDNLSTGHKKLIPEGAKFIFGDIRDENLISRVVHDEKVDAIIHFAAKLYVEESVQNPISYYETNVSGGINVINAALKNGVEKFIFSSTAAVYGSAGEEMVFETAKIQPENPYGASKAMFEQVLSNITKKNTVNTLRAVVLRYFNVAGATLDLRHGEIYPESTHLIKVASQVATGKRSQLIIHGTDYPTIDGTGVRDYIHVLDLAQAHVDALKYLETGGESDVFNCGYGVGFSVRQVLDSMQKVTGVPLKVVEGPRRAGDASQIVANSTKAQKILGWKPRYNDIGLICKTAYDWEKTLS